MKVKLLARKGNNKAGSTVEYDDVSAEWLVRHGYAEPVKESKSEKRDEEASPAPRRGRPPKNVSRS